MTSCRLGYKMPKPPWRQLNSTAPSKRNFATGKIVGPCLCPITYWKPKAGGDLDSQAALLKESREKESRSGTLQGMSHTGK